MLNHRDLVREAKYINVVQREQDGISSLSRDSVESFLGSKSSLQWLLKILYPLSQHSHQPQRTGKPISLNLFYFYKVPLPWPDDNSEETWG